MLWNGKPYHSLDFYLKETFGRKIYKLALDGGMTCPNRDGTLGSRGCIFCSEGGSGEFAEPFDGHGSADGWIQAAKSRVSKKTKGDARYIAYFQCYTNTYASPQYLEKLFTPVLLHPEIAALSVGTRPDCLPEEVLCLLERLNRIKPVWVELGLQTIHPATADFIRRRYPLSRFEEAFRALRGAHIQTVAHTILGLPHETKSLMLDTVRYLGRLGVDGVKLQLLHVLKGTDLAQYYENTGFPLMSLDEYADLIVDCIGILPPRTVIHRISGDGPKRLLIAPAWSGDKRRVLNTIAGRFRERGEYQGSHFHGADTFPSPSISTPNDRPSMYS